jgi:hypothetical protein
VLKGLLAGGITMGVAAVFPESLVLPLFVGILGLLAGVYPGVSMALSMEGRPGLQWTAALAVVALALVGLWVSPLFLAAAWLLLGLWSLLHRLTGLAEGLPEGYAVFALSYSVVMAGFVVYVWAVGG